MAKPIKELRKIRLQKLEKIKKLGVDPYPPKFDRSHSCAKASKSLGKKVKVAGRITSLRAHGGSTFADLKDESGKIQVFFKRDKLGKKDYEFLKLLDIGDFLGVAGKVFKTEAGEVTVEVSDFRLLTKALRPLPSTWYGLKDVEIRHRKRYLDLLMNPKIREGFVLRSKIITALRKFLDSCGFLEVELPVLQPIAGGAAAKPFITHLEALHQDYYLRIAPELYLKRLLVGGYEKVYEIAKAFRNEGFSPKHNPEYTLLEIYEAYTDYEDIMKLAEEMLIYVAKAVLGKTNFEFQGKKISLKTPFQRIKMRDIILDKTRIDIDKIKTEKLREYLKKEKVEVLKTDDRGRLIDKLFAHKIEENLVQPTFVIDLPIEVSPLAKKVPGKPRYVQRFELYMGGIELANAYSELNDPQDQKERFLEQAKKREAGVEEAHPLDEDFIEALEYGMPPAGGIGFGVDRVVLLFANFPNIREVILFPIFRPEKKE